MYLKNKLYNVQCKPKKKKTNKQKKTSVGIDKPKTIEDKYNL